MTSTRRLRLAATIIAAAVALATCILLARVSTALAAFLLATRRAREFTGALGLLLVVLVAQAAVGYTQWFTGVPALLVGVHVLGAVAVWVAVLRREAPYTLLAATLTPAGPVGSVIGIAWIERKSGSWNSGARSPRRER